MRTLKVMTLTVALISSLPLLITAHRSIRHRVKIRELEARMELLARARG